MPLLVHTNATLSCDARTVQLYANSTDGIKWEKPNLNRYDLQARWGKDPAVSKYGKRNNIVMYGGLGIYHDIHDANPALRYTIRGRCRCSGLRRTLLLVVGPSSVLYA